MQALITMHIGAIKIPVNEDSDQGWMVGDQCLPLPKIFYVRCGISWVRYNNTTILNTRQYNNSARDLTVQSLSLFMRVHIVT